MIGCPSLAPVGFYVHIIYHGSHQCMDLKYIELRE
jgi:hypothetical protein